MMIAYHFKQVYGAVADSESSRWDGKGGIVSKIRKDLHIPSGTKLKSIRKVMEEVHEA